jgi:hypothetical protein
VPLADDEDDWWDAPGIFPEDDDDDFDWNSGFSFCGVGGSLYSTKANAAVR